MSSVIICGFGEVGKSAAHQLRSGKLDFIVIDIDRTKFNGVYADVPHILGDATQEAVLRKAGIEDAETLIVCTHADETNAFIILCARILNPEITILARAERLESVEKLYKAGANYVVPSTTIGGRLLAKHAIAPHVAAFVDRVTVAKDVEITNLVVGEHSPVKGKRLKHSKIRESTGVTVLALKRGEHLIPNPGGNYILHNNDTLIVIGSGEQIKKLSELLKG